MSTIRVLVLGLAMNSSVLASAQSVGSSPDAVPAAAEIRSNLASPNVLIVLADDLGWGDPGCYGAGSKVPTPAFDRLAEEGMRFTDAHSPSAVCTPTRYGLLTGRFCWRTRLKSGVLGNGYARALLEEDRSTLGHLFSAASFHTGVVGKWHLGWNWRSTDGSDIDGGHHQAIDWSAAVDRGPSTVGFAFSYLLPASLDMAPYVWLRNDRAVLPGTSHTPGSKRRWSGGGGFWRAGAIAPGFEFEDVLPNITEQSVAFLEEHARERPGQPFFLYVPLASPHTPWMPTPEWQGSTEVSWYGDFVAQTDHAVGRILQALDRNGLAENTLVVVTSDNGSHWPAEQQEQFGHPANGPWRGMKADIHEGGHRVPFLVRWPEVVAARTVSDALVGLVDLYATCADILGVEPEADEAEDSVSFLPVLRGEREDVREELVLHSMNGTFALRQGDWKWIDGNLGSGGFTQPKNVEPSDGRLGQLYHLGEDPTESRDLGLEQPELVARLRERLAAIRGVELEN